MKSKTLQFAVFFTLIFLFATTFVQSATYFSIASGNWSNATGTVWSLTSGGAALAANVKPGAADDVTIERGFTVTVDETSACTSVQLGRLTTAGAGTLTFSGSSTLTVSGAVLVGNNIAASNGTITFTSGSTLIAGSLRLGGTIAAANGTITMTAGGTLSLGGALTIGTGTATWTPGTGTVIFTGTNTLPATIFTTFNNLQINDGTTTTAVNLTAIAALTIGSLGTFTTAAARTITATTVTINGTYTNGSTGAMTITNLAVGSTGIYNHNSTAAALIRGSTTSAWDAASNCNINGAFIASTLITNFIGQSFGDVTYNCTGQTATVMLGWATGTATVKGNFTVSSTGTSTLYLRLSGAGNAFSPTVNITGNFSLSGTSKLDLNNGGGTASTTIINLAGDFSMTGTSTLLESTTTANTLSQFNFTKSGTQTFTKDATAAITSGATLLDGIKFTVNSGSVLDMGTSVLTGSNGTDFTLSSGAGIITANTGGLAATGTATGSIQVAGTRTFSTGANYTYNGSSAQVTGTGLPSSVNNLTISNAAGVTFTASETVVGTMAIGASGQANLGSFTSYASALTLNGVSQGTGTYGSTSSSATNQSNTYWAGTGIVSVGTLPPSALSYTSPNSFATGVAITPLSPTVTGVPTGYTVLPALPTGLSIDPSTGVISGTPTVSTASATYTVTASNGGGSTSFGVVIAVGVNFYARASTAWNVASTWSLTSGGTAGTSVPGAGDNVFISDASVAFTVTIPTAYNAVCGSLTIGKNTTGASVTAGVLTFTDNLSTLTVGGNVIINKPNSSTVTNLINLNAGTLTVNGNVELSRVQTASTTASRISRINITTGTMTVAGNLTFSATAAGQSQIIFSGAGFLNIAGSFTLTSNLGTLTPSTGTVNFNGAAQTVPFISAVTYNNLSLSGSGVKTLPAALLTIPGNLSLSGTASATTVANLAITGTLTIGSEATLATGTNFTLRVTGATSVTGTLNLAGTGAKTFTGDVTVNALGVWNETGIAAINYAGNLQNDGTTFTALSGVHTFTGATKTLSGASEIAIPNVTVTSPGTYTNSGILTISTALSGTGSLTNGNGTIGTLNLGGTSGITTFSATPVGNTVNYTGTGQTLRVTAYHHLELSGGAKTFGAITTVAGNLTLSGAATATTGAGLTVSGNLSIGDGTTLTAAAFALTVTGTTTVGDGATGNLIISSATGAKLFTGLVTIASGGTWNNSGNSPLEFRGGITTTPTFTGGTGVHTFTTNAQALTGTFTIPGVTVTTITLTNNNSLTVATALSGTGGLTQAANADLLIGGTSGITALTATAADNLVNYTGGAQTVHPGAFYNLILSGTDSKTTTGVTVNNILSMEGTTATASALPTYGASAILQYKGSDVQVTGAEFPATITGGTLAGIRIENASGVTLNGTKNIGARYLTIGSLVSNSLFNDGGYQLTATGTLNLTSGTFKLGAASATTFPAFTTNTIAAGTTVDYASTSAQTVRGETGAGFTYSNLTISGTGNKTAGGNITVDGILTLTPNATATHGSLEMITTLGTYPGRTTVDYASLVSYTLYMGSSATTEGTGDVTGIVTRNYTITANTPYAFGNKYTTISLTDGTMPTALAVKTTIGATGQGPADGDIIRDAIKRTYEIVPTGGSGSFVTANFHYLDNELISSINSYENTPLKMTTMDYDIGSGASVSDEHGRTNFDYTNKYIGLSGIPISYFIFDGSTHNWRTIFTLRDYAAGYYTWNGSQNNTVWGTALNWTLSGGGNGVPTTTGHVIIPDKTLTNNYSPALPSGITTINTISIRSGGALTMGGNTLKIQNTISGGWEDQNSPTGNDPGLSKVIFNRPNASVSGNARFYDVEINAIDATIDTIADITNQAGSTMKIENSITRTGYLTGGKWYADVFSNTVEYSKSADQTILKGDGPHAYWNLMLSGTGVKSMPASSMSFDGNFTTSGTVSATAGGTMTIGGNVTLGSGTTFDASTFTHSVGGDWTNNGATFTQGTSTVNFNNTLTAQAINGTAASQTFNNINIDKSSASLTVGGSTTSLTVNDLTETSGDFTAPATLTVNGNATLTSGTFTAGANTYLKGNWSNNGGTFIPGTGMVTFNGTPAQTLSGTNTYYDLTINNGAGVTATASQTVNHTLYLQSANASSTQGCLNMTDPNQLIMGPSATTTGTGDVNGYITRTSFVLGTNYTFGNPNTLMNFTVGPLPSSVSVKVYLTGAEPSWMGSNVGIWRYYDVTQSGGTADTRLRFNAHYLDSELHGATGASLDFFDHHESGPYAGSTHDHGRYDNSTASDPNNWVGFNNVGLVFLGTATLDDHLWTLGNNSTGTTSTWIGGSPSGATDWNLPGNWLGGVPAAASDVHIPATTYAPVLPDGPTAILSIEIQSGGILNATTGTPILTISGGAGAWVNTGTFNAGSSTVTFTGASADMAGSTNFNNITIGGSTTLTMLAGSVMGINGTLTKTGSLDASTNSNTIQYMGAAQTVVLPTGTPAQYSNLILGGSGTKTMPVSAMNVLGNYSITGTALAIAGAAISTTGSFTIGAGASYTAGANAHTYGSFVINSDATGTGSFIATTSFTGTVQRYIPNDLKWHFLSSPVTAQPVWPEFAPAPESSTFGAAPWSWDFYYWNPNASTTNELYWVNLRKVDGAYNDGTIDASGSTAGFGSATPAFNIGKGYLVAYSTSWNEATGSPETHLFSGTINNSTATRAVVTGTNGWNLAGNPFPSSLDWQATSGWARDNLTTSGSGKDMWIYNATAGNYGVINSASGDGTNLVSRNIAPMQAFFVNAASSGDLIMGSDAQVHSTQNWLKNSSDVENSLSLVLTTSGNTYSDEMIISVNPVNDNGGSFKFWSVTTEAPELYAIKNNINYSIDRIPSVNESSVVPIGIKAGLDASYTINVSGVDNFYTAKSIILEDLKTGITQELKINPIYSFTATVQDSPERFHLHFGGPFGIETPENKPDFTIYSFNNTVYINNISGKNILGNLFISDILGRRITEKKIMDQNTIINLSAPAGYYIVTLVTNSQTFSQKVFIH